jgi:hypothetical protein
LYIHLLLGLPSRYIQHVSLYQTFWQCRPKSNEAQTASFHILSNSLFILTVSEFDCMWSDLLTVSFNKQTVTRRTSNENWNCSKRSLQDK